MIRVVLPADDVFSGIDDVMERDASPRHREQAGDGARDGGLRARATLPMDGIAHRKATDPAAR